MTAPAIHLLRPRPSTVAICGEGVWTDGFRAVRSDAGANCEACLQERGDAPLYCAVDGCDRAPVPGGPDADLCDRHALHAIRAAAAAPAPFPSASSYGAPVVDEEADADGDPPLDPPARRGLTATPEEMGRDADAILKVAVAVAELVGLGFLLWFLWRVLG